MHKPATIQQPLRLLNNMYLLDVVDVDQIPDETSIESKVHLDLAGFHRENDERIVAERGCSSDGRLTCSDYI